MRHDFSPRTVDVLAARAGGRCSNPGCRRLTSGLRAEPDKAVNIGVAAHITAAAEGGPRHDPNLTPQERCHADNGLWLCQNCAKLVDNDPTAYPVHRLRAWKRQAEDAARQEVEQRGLHRQSVSTGTQGGWDPDQASGVIQIGGGIQADRIQVHNLVSGVQVISDQTGCDPRDLCQQVAALRGQLVQETATGRPEAESAGEKAPGAPPTAGEELSGAEPKGEWMAGKLKEDKKVPEE